MFFGRLRRALGRFSLRLTLWLSLLFMASALALLVLTDVLLRNRAAATEHYVIESRLNQYVSEYKRGGLAAVQHLGSLRRGRAQQAFFVRVGDAQNQTVYLRHADDWAEFHPEKLDGQPLPPSGERPRQTLPSDDGSSLMLEAERLPDGGVLQVGKANEDLRDVLTDFRRASLLVLAIFVPASFAVGAFIASRALRPVQQLTSVAQGIVETQKLDARVPTVGSGDELDAMGQIFNQMLGRIEALVHGMRESLDHVAHDLRTPLTRLRHKAQSVLEAEQHTARTPALEALAECVEEADRIGTILNTLADIVEAESGAAKLDLAPVPLARLVADAVDSYAAWSEDRQVRIAAEVPAELRVKADATALFRVLANLLDNALKYTPAGGTVAITAKRRGGEVEIAFADTGIGIAAEDLPRIWERLFRADRSRTERGLGLGLTFVRAIVEAHGGSVAAESTPGRGTTIRLTLPLA